MQIEKANKYGTLGISLKAIAETAQDTVTGVYGVLGLVDRRKDFSKNGKILGAGELSNGVTVKEEKNGYEVSLYICVSKDVKITEVCLEVQKQVAYNLSRTFGIKFKNINVFIGGIK